MGYDRKRQNWMCQNGIVNLFPVIDEFSPQRELFRAISAKNGVKLPEKGKRQNSEKDLAWRSLMRYACEK